MVKPNEPLQHYCCLPPLAGILVLLLASSAVASSEVGWSIGTKAEHSSNPRRLAAGSEAGIVSTVDAGINVRREGPRVDAALELDAARSRYPDRAFDDENEFSAYGELDLAVVPDYVTWVVRDRFARIREAELQAVTPDSRQNVNAFVTGPDITLPLTQVDSARLSMRYGRYDFSETPTDNTRMAATVGLERRVSPRTVVSLNVGTEHVDFAEEFGAQVDFERHSVFVRGERSLARGLVELDLGYSEVRRDGLDTVSGPLVELRAEQRIGAQATAGVGLTVATTDPITGFASSPGDPLAASVDRITLTGEVGELRRAQAFADAGTGPVRWNAGIGVGREVFDTGDDIDRYDARLGLDWRLTARLSAYANTRGVESRFAPDDRRERIVLSTAGLQRQLGRNLVGRFGVSRFEQTFDDDADRITDDRVMLALRYEVQRRVAMGRR